MPYYYSVIGGWVVKYLADYVLGRGSALAAADGYFSAFISNGVPAEVCFVIFAALTLTIIFAGVENGIERVSKFMMPVLVVLSIIIASIPSRGRARWRASNISSCRILQTSRG